MIQFILKRLFYGFVVLILVVCLVSSIIYLSPVDPARLTFGQRTDTQSIALKRAELGLDKPLVHQLGLYLRDVSPFSVHKDQAERTYAFEKVSNTDEQVLLSYPAVTDSLDTLSRDTVLLVRDILVRKDKFEEAKKVLTTEINTQYASKSSDDKLYIEQLDFNLREVEQISQSFMIDNKAKYKYQKLIPLGGGKHFVLKMPYLRNSYQTDQPVLEILKEAVPKTALLALVAMIFATIIGILLGVVASLKQYSWFDNTAVITSVMGYSLPSYVTALLIAYFFGFYLGDYTGLNIKGSITELNDMGDEIVVWKNLILPAVALGIRPIALITQLTRSSMLDVLSQDYIRTARSKGLSYYQVVFKHALRNALNPILTAASGWFAALLAGAFFVESVFGYNGLGDKTVTALLNFDVPVVLGSVLFTAVVFVIVNILVDILYAVLDPRVRVGG